MVALWLNLLMLRRLLKNDLLTIWLRTTRLTTETCVRTGFAMHPIVNEIHNLPPQAQQEVINLVAALVKQQRYNPNHRLK